MVPAGHSEVEESSADNVILKPRLNMKIKQNNITDLKAMTDEVEEWWTKPIECAEVNMTVKYRTDSDRMQD